jgi:predicted transcriptional regulator
MLVPRPEANGGADLEKILDALSKDHSRMILQTATEPMSVKQLSHLCDLPLSSTYRRVNRLEEANLLEPKIKLDPEHGKHVTQYERAFDSIEMEMTSEGIAVNVMK